ncbi:MAG: ABC transporter ATP-binding protein [Oceanipulchritudo sp.]|jgi:phospholipid/cholesterol/gamma-HCH transport system ATP-binding protein
MNRTPQPETGPHIEVRNLTMAFGDSVVMRDLDFTINRGDIFIIMGASGSGKSTLMRHLIGLEEPFSGDILFAGRSFVRAEARAREEMMRRLGVMYQSGALWSSMTLAENVALPLEQFTRLDRGQIRSIVSYKLALVGLSGYEEFYPAAISGGMAKRAGVARALALDPQVLFLDEPSAGLDPMSALRMDQLILELRDTLGMTIVVVSHELDSLLMIGTNGIFLDKETRTQGAVGDPRLLRETCDNPTIRDFLTRGGHLTRTTWNASPTP